MRVCVLTRVPLPLATPLAGLLLLPRLTSPYVCVHAARRCCWLLLGRAQRCPALARAPHQQLP